MVKVNQYTNNPTSPENKKWTPLFQTPERMYVSISSHITSSYSLVSDLRAASDILQTLGLNLKPLSLPDLSHLRTVATSTCRILATWLGVKYFSIYFIRVQPILKPSDSFSLGLLPSNLALYIIGI